MWWRVLLKLTSRPVLRPTSSSKSFARSSFSLSELLSAFSTSQRRSLGPWTLQRLFTPPGGGFINEVRVTVTNTTDAVLPQTDILVHAVAGAQVADLTLHLVGVPGGVVTVDPTSGSVPQRLQPGTEITVHGTGFCADAQVIFGADQLNIGTTRQPLAPATPTAVAADGRSLTVSVPRLATTGHLTVTTPGGHAYSSPQMFSVDSWRDTLGFSFGNVTNPGVSFDDVVELFGQSQTHISVFGASTDIPDLFALLFTLIADQALGGIGTCFGYSLGTQRFFNRDASLADYPAHLRGTIAGDAWELADPDGASPRDPGGASPQLAHYLHVLHTAQLSAEFLHYWLAQTSNRYLRGGEGADIRAQVSEALRKGDYPLVCLLQGTKGHVLPAYDVADSADVPEGFDLYVYDPDVPFLVSEDSDGGAHFSNVTQSRITVDVNGNWTLPSQGWRGEVDGIVVVPYDVTPLQPTLPASFVGLLTLILGQGGTTRQLADLDGRTLLQQDGSINRDTRTLLPSASRFAPLDSRANTDIYLLGGPGPYVHTVESTEDAPFTYTMSPTTSLRASRICAGRPEAGTKSPSMRPHSAYPYESGV